LAAAAGFGEAGAAALPVVVPTAGLRARLGRGLRTGAGFGVAAGAVAVVACPVTVETVLSDFLAFLAAVLAAFLSALDAFFFALLATFFSLTSDLFSTFLLAFSVFLVSFLISLATFFASFSAVFSTDFFSFFDSVVSDLSFSSSVEAISVVRLLVFDFMIIGLVKWDYFLKKR
jgi:hypothetical protein